MPLSVIVFTTASGEPVSTVIVPGPAGWKSAPSSAFSTYAVSLTAMTACGNPPTAICAPT